MTKADRKERERQIRREDIIDAAEKIFFNDDYDNVTMKEIAREAEMSRGTLYLYFKNKDDIYAAIALRAAKIVNNSFQEILTDDQIGIEKIGSLCKFYYGFFKNHPGYFNVYYHSGMFEIPGSSTLVELRDIRKKSFKLAADIVKAGIKDGSLRDDLDLVVTTLFTLSTSTLVSIINPGIQMYMDEYRLTQDMLFERTLDLIMQSIKNNTSQ